MDEKAVDKMFENLDKLREKIKEIKKIKDYGINCTRIRESIMYPKIGGMRQDIWLSKEDKIEVKYVDEEIKFEINLIFKDGSIVEALEVIIIYLSHWNNNLYSENVKIYLEEKQLPILEYIQLTSKLNKEGLKLEEEYQNEIYGIVEESVWISVEGVIDVIKSLDKTEKISLKINKIEGRENFWQYMSCIRISFDSKYYEEGYLENLEWRRLEPLFKEWESKNTTL